METIEIVAIVIVIIALGALLGRALFEWHLKIEAKTEVDDKEKED